MLQAVAATNSPGDLNMSRLPHVTIFLSLFLAAGCTEAKSKPADDNSGKGIFGKKTQDIGEFDKNKANQVVSDQKIHATDPITGPLAAYGPMVERISMIEITSALNLFNAENGRFPRDHEEFMEKIIKANNIQLPVLPYKGQYKYDVEKHELVVVRSIEDAEKAK
jgi:hypothetical protein